MKLHVLMSSNMFAEFKSRNKKKSSLFPSIGFYNYFGAAPEMLQYVEGIFKS